MTENKKASSQGVAMPLIGAPDRLLSEIDNFFDGNTSGKIKSLNSVLNAFINEGRGRLYMNQNFVPDTVFDVTAVVDFLSSCSELWEHIKSAGCEVEFKSMK